MITGFVRLSARHPSSYTTQNLNKSVILYTIEALPTPPNLNKLVRDRHGWDEVDTHVPKNGDQARPDIK